MILMMIEVPAVIVKELAAEGTNTVLFVRISDNLSFLSFRRIIAV